jgi:hypothetical protein
VDGDTGVAFVGKKTTALALTPGTWRLGTRAVLVT